MIIRIPLPPRFSFDAVIRSHGWYDLPPFAYDAQRGVLATRIEAGGAGVPIEFRSKNGELHVQSGKLGRKILASIAARVFSLDVDLDGFARSLDSRSTLA